MRSEPTTRIPQTIWKSLQFVMNAWVPSLRKIVPWTLFFHGFLAICYVARIIFSDNLLREKKRTCFFLPCIFPSHSFTNIWYPVYLFIKLLKMETAKVSSSFAQEWNLTFGKIAQKKRVSSWNLTDYVIFCQVECDNIAVENGFHPQDVIYTWFTTIWMTESGRLKRHLAPTAI